MLQRRRKIPWKSLKSSRFRKCAKMLFTNKHHEICAACQDVWWGGGRSQAICSSCLLTPILSSRRWRLTRWKIHWGTNRGGCILIKLIHIPRYDGRGIVVSSWWRWYVRFRTRVEPLQVRLIFFLKIFSSVSLLTYNWSSDEWPTFIWTMPSHTYWLMHTQSQSQMHNMSYHRCFGVHS